MSKYGGDGDYGRVSCCCCCCLRCRCCLCVIFVCFNALFTNADKFNHVEDLYSLGERC